MTILIAVSMYLGAAVAVTPDLPATRAAAPEVSAGQQHDASIRKPPPTACWSYRDIMAFNSYDGFAAVPYGALRVRSKHVERVAGCTYHVVVKFEQPSGQTNDFIATYEGGKFPTYLMLFSSVDELPAACAGWMLPASAVGGACDTDPEIAPPLGSAEHRSKAPDSRNVGLRSHDLRIALVLMLAAVLALGGTSPNRQRALPMLVARVTAVSLLASVAGSALIRQTSPVSQSPAVGRDHEQSMPAGQGAFRMRDYQTVSGATMNADLDVTADSLVVVVKSEPFTRYHDGIRVYAKGFTVRCTGSRERSIQAATIETHCDIGASVRGPTWTWHFDATTDTWTRDTFRTIRPGWVRQVFERVRTYDALTG